MNYLHPQLFFPISLVFPPLFILLFAVRGILGPESHGESLTVNSAGWSSCCRHHSVPIFLFIPPHFPFVIFIPSFCLRPTMSVGVNALFMATQLSPRESILEWQPKLALKMLLSALKKSNPQSNLSKTHAAFVISFVFPKSIYTG